MCRIAHRDDDITAQKKAACMHCSHSFRTSLRILTTHSSITFIPMPHAHKIFSSKLFTLSSETSLSLLPQTILHKRLPHLQPAPALISFSLHRAAQPPPHPITIPRFLSTPCLRHGDTHAGGTFSGRSKPPRAGWMYSRFAALSSLANTRQGSNFSLK